MSKSISLATVPTATGTPPSSAPAPSDGLDPLVWPHFFRGQLLTDADLDTLVKAVRAQRRLGHFQAGWGVVCGLGVTLDPAQPTVVIVGPGYAMTACGDDVIVGQAKPFDLADILAKPGLDAPAERTVDLAIEYAEEETDLQPALGGNGCAAGSNCEYSRLRAISPVTATLVSNPDSDPVLDGALDWHTQYDRWLDGVRYFHEWFHRQARSADDIKAELQDWLRQHPVRQSRQLRERVLNWASDREADLTDLLFWLAVESRNAFLFETCPGCAGTARVPLARLTLTSSLDNNQRRYAVARIDTFPPYRRLLGPAAWPAPVGQINLAPVVWQRWEEAQRVLTHLGLNAKRVPFTMPATLLELEQTLTRRPLDAFARLGEDVIVQVYDADPALGPRVVAFSGVLPPPRLGLAVVKDSQPGESRAGWPVVYSFEVSNTGEADLVVELQDDMLGLVGRGILLNPGAMQRIERVYTVPLDATGSLTNTATVTGKARDGRTITQASQPHTLKVTPATLLGLFVAKTSDPTEARAGDTVKFTFAVRNLGNTDMAIDVEDSQFGTIATGAVLPAGADKQFEYSYTVPQTVSGDIRNDVTVIGHTAQGLTGIATASHTLKVIAPPGPPFDLLKSAEADVARPGDSIVYTFIVRNTSREEWTTEIEDDLIGSIASDCVFKPDDDMSWCVEYEVEEDARGEIKNTVTLVAVNRAGQSKTMTASHTLTIIPEDDLTQIEGITPARAEELHEAGITTFGALAETSADYLQELFPNLGREILQRWIERAEELADIRR